jgi:N-acetylneuraminate lyase
LKICGILPAVVTPIDDAERFVPASFERLLERVYDAGSHGVYVSGNTGEGMAQPVGEREAVIEAAVRNSPKDKLVVAHVGAHRTSDAIRLAKFSAMAGVAAVSSLPPFGMSYDETKTFYTELAAATDCPVLVYYFPLYSGAIDSLAALLELSDIPNVAGIKFTGFDLYTLSQLKKSGAVVFNGHDEVLAAGLLMGADGGIGSFYNLIPDLFVRVYELAQYGDWEGAREVQGRINELVEITLRYPYLAAIKLMLKWSGIDCGACYEPRRRLTAEEEQSLAGALAVSSFAGAPFTQGGRSG